MHRVETVILGAGLTGLATAYHLGHDYLLVEKDERVGGLTRTEVIDGFFFDHTGHWLHLRHDGMRALVSELLGDDLRLVERDSRIWSFGRYTAYPFQANLHGLPLPVVKECLMALVEERIAAAEAEGRGTPRPAPRNFLEYVERHFGAGIAKHFMIPYNTKLWGCAPTEITADWCSRFVPIPNLAQIVEGAIGPSQQMGYNVRFVYPAEGGIETLVTRFAARLDASAIATGVRPTRIDWRARTMTLSDGRELGYERLVSSLPLPELLRVLVDAPDAVREHATRLRCTSLRYVNLGLAVERPFDGAHWIYLPENKYPFYRIGCASNAMASLAPPGAASCYVEVSNAHTASDAEVLAALRAFLKEIGAIERDEQILVAEMRQIPYGYVIFDDHYFPAKNAILPFLEANGIRSTGRYGAWTYSSMEDALLDGAAAAAEVRAHARGHA